METNARTRDAILDKLAADREGDGSLGDRQRFEGTISITPAGRRVVACEAYDASGNLMARCEPDADGNFSGVAFRPGFGVRVRLILDCGSWAEGRIDSYGRFDFW